jgi:hypothetical protein
MPSLQIGGILLYPEVETSFIDHFSIQSHPIRIASINLNQNWKSIHKDLIRIIS